MKKGYLFSVFLLLAILCVIGFGESRSVSTSAKSLTKELQEKSRIISETNKNMAVLQDKYYEEKLSKLLSKDQLMSMAKQQWSYSLTVNDEEFKNGTITSAGRNIVIILRESLKSKDNLPSSILKSGSLASLDDNDAFHEHIKISSTVSYTKAVNTDQSGSTAVYTFKNIPEATIISLSLSEPLRERLKSDYSMLDIIVK